MRIAKSTLVIAAVLLLGVATLLSLLLGTEQPSVELAGDGTSVERLPQSFEFADRVDPGSPAERFRGGIDRTATLQSTAQLLQSLGTSLTASTEEALQLETDTRFAEFLAGLEGSPQRIDAIRDQLIIAYGEILAFGIALQQGDISPTEAEARTDPNYVLNRMAELLSAQELTELETFMESQARERFLATYNPQLDLIGVQLGAENRDRLLETLFTETHLSVNRDGLNPTADLEAGFQRQLDAIANTRASLRASMTPEQFEQANVFLDEQERGLLGAQTIFSSN